MSLTIHEDLQQGTDEWLAARRGIVTASVVDKLIHVGAPDAITVDCPTCGAKAGGSCMSLAAKKAPTAIKTIHEGRSLAAAELPPVYGVADNDTSRALVATLVAERVSGVTEDHGMTRDMWRGVVHEPFARDAYAQHHGEVVEVGFMVREEANWTLGYSPDGLMGDDGLLEIKAPRSKTHLLTVIAGEVPSYNLAQLQAGLLVSGRKWIDFVPFVSGLPLWVKRVTPDPAWQQAIVAACIAFETSAAELTDAYTQATQGLPITERVPDYEPVELKLA